MPLKLLQHLIILLLVVHRIMVVYGNLRKTEQGEETFDVAIEGAEEYQ